MEYPTGIWIDSEETVYVCEGSPHKPVTPTPTPRISIRDKQGNLLESLHAPSPPHWIYGDSQGSLYLARPYGLQPVAKYQKRS